MRNYLGVLLLMLVFISCIKEKQEISPFNEYKLPKLVRLNGIVCTSEKEWFVVGGKKMEEGYVFHTKDAGLTWSTFQTDEVSNLYTIAFRDSLNGMAGGDRCFYWTTADGGATWHYRWLAQQVPFNGEDRPAIRDIQYVGDSTVLFCCGESFNKGVFYRTTDLGQSWQFDFYPHELRTILLSNQNGSAQVSGYGFGINVSSNYAESAGTDLSGRYIMASATHKSDFFQVDFEGSVSKSNSVSGPWNEVYSGRKLFSKRITLNAIASNESSIAVVGNEGVVLISENDGQNWKTFALENKPHLFDVAWTGKNWLAVSDEGVVYAFN